MVRTNYWTAKEGGYLTVLYQVQRLLASNEMEEDRMIRSCELKIMRETAVVAYSKIVYGRSCGLSKGMKTLQSVQCSMSQCPASISRICLCVTADRVMCETNG